MKWSTGALSTLTSDTDFSVAATLDAGRYIFNCPENTTRTSIQFARGFRKVKAIFFTRVHTDTIAGLPGYLLTLADSGSTNIELYGPQGLAHYIVSTRGYAWRPQLKLTVSEIAPEADSFCQKDAMMAVLPVPVTPAYSPHLKRKRSEGDTRDISPRRLPCETESQSGAPHPPDFVRTRPETHHTPWEKKTMTLGFSNEDTEADGDSVRRSNHPGDHGFPLAPPIRELVVNYICRGPEVRGKFNAKRANELGVQGPDRAKLTRGETITTKTGTIVTPDMCVALPESPTIFFVIDCPSRAYVDGLVSSPQFDAYKLGGSSVVHCIYHRLCREILDDEGYVDWMHSFGPNVHHLVSSCDYNCDPITFTTPTAAQLRLSQLDPAMFPVPKYSLHPKRSLADACKPLPPLTALLDPQTRVDMRPPSAPGPFQHGYIDAFHPLLAPSDDSAEHTEILDARVNELFAVAKSNQAVAEDTRPGDHVVIHTLGTGSAAPSLYRNVISTLVRIPSYGSVMLDCGEGTWGQLCRQFGRPEVDQVLRDIKCIYLSHKHADHHAGVATVLSHRRKLVANDSSAPPLYLILPRWMIWGLREVQQLEDLGLDSDSIVVLFAENLVEAHESPHADVVMRCKDQAQKLCLALGLMSISTVRVEHRCLCFGVVLKSVEGWSIVYSGDTQPCDALVEAGQGATLLIHEATMADDEADLALRKTHSTFGQAIDVGKRMNAENLLLTHFSSRYPKFPTRSKEQVEKPVVGVGFDFATLRIGTMARMNGYLSAIEQSIADAFEDDISVGGDGT